MLSLFSQKKKIHELRLALNQANTELEKIRKKNESMRQGMRYCVTCDYRIEAKQQAEKVKKLSQKN